MSDFKCIETKKMIGYRCPIDLRSGKIKAGSIYVADHNGYYSTESTDGKALMEKEMVETWEPVYGATEEIITIGSRNVPVTISDIITFKGRVATIKEVNDTYNAIYNMYKSLGTISEYGVYLDSDTRFIRIGCEDENNRFSLNELRQVINTYYRINNSTETV